jgi:hypothetical protein
MGALKTRTKITPEGQLYAEIGDSDGGYLFIGKKGIALWRELKRRQGNGLVPQRKDWIAVTKERMEKAVKAVRKRGNSQ